MLASIHGRRSGWALSLLLALLGCDEGDAGSARAAEGRTGTDEPTPQAEAEAEPAEPQGPPKRIFAKRFVVNVRTEPSREAPRVGYLRGGAVLLSTGPEPVGHEGCKGGWYELSTGGYVCNGRDVIAFEGERLPEVRSTQPDRSAKLPYEYGFIRKDRTPMYRRLPSQEDIERYEIGAREDTEGSEGSEGSESSEGAGSKEEGEGTGADAGAGEGTETGSPSSEGADDPEDAGPPTLDSLEAGEEDSDILQRWLMRGFYVSLDKTFDVRWRRYWRTQQNGFVPYQNVMLVDGSDFQGRELDGEEWTLPVGFVTSGRTRRYVAKGDRILRDRKKPGYHHVFRIVGEREQRGRAYYEGHDGYFYRADDIVRVDAVDRPEEITDHKWVDVDLGKQTLVAYEGERPVYVTLISSGRVRREDVEELNHETPKGVFRFTSKHLTHKMDGDNAIDGPYSIDDVPYVMYFELAYATHTAFWHNRFGRPKSHGCVNMAPLDARWVFEWAAPELPEGWHGIYPTEDGPGTSIRIHGETPRG